MDVADGSVVAFEDVAAVGSANAFEGVSVGLEDKSKTSSVEIAAATVE